MLCLYTVTSIECPILCVLPGVNVMIYHTHEKVNFAFVIAVTMFVPTIHIQPKRLRMYLRVEWMFDFHKSFVKYLIISECHECFPPASCASASSISTIFDVSFPFVNNLYLILILCLNASSSSFSPSSFI